MKYKITVTMWNEQGCRVSIQKNENGLFGKTEKLFLSAEDIKGYDRQQVLELIDRIMNGQSPRARPNRSYPFTDGEDVQENEIDLGQKIEERIESIKGRIQENISPILMGLGVLGVLIITLMFYSNSTTQVERKDNITVMNNEIDLIRNERERVYNDCLSVCEADRSIYDAQVQIRKSKIIKEKISLNKGNSFLKTLFE